MDTDNKIKLVLKYDTSRHYFAGFSPDALSAAYGRLKTSASWNIPDVTTSLYVGKIDGNVICNALWNEMSYNPVRFGTVSPFVFNNKNNLFAFCDRRGASHINSDILAEIRHKLIVYMNINSDSNGGWYDAVRTNATGYVSIQIIDGHSNDNYKILAMLRDCITIIARQNVADFKKKRGPYRNAIIDVVRSRHPDWVRGTRAHIAQPQKKTPVMAPDVPVDDEEERFDKMMENLQITLDNEKYVSPDVYQQAQEDILAVARYQSQFEK